MAKLDPPTTAYPRDVTRIVPNPTALKALAHPDRLKMLGLLRLEGPATATILAKRMGLNSGATSYHLRQLATHGFIEQADELGNRRDRWWRSRHESTTFDSSEAQDDALEAGLALSGVVLGQHVAQMQRAEARYRELPVEWRRASTASDFHIPLTAEAARQLVDKLEAVLWEAKAAAPPPGGPLPEGVQDFTVILHAFPYTGFAPDTPAEDA